MLGSTQSGVRVSKIWERCCGKQDGGAFWGFASDSAQRYVGVCDMKGRRVDVGQRIDSVMRERDRGIGLRARSGTVCDCWCTVEVCWVGIGAMLTMGGLPR